MKTELLDAHLSGDLDKDQAAAVESALRNDEALREVYFQQLRMDAALQVLFTGKAEVTEEEFKRGVTATLMSEGADTGREFSKSVLTEILEEKEQIVPTRWPDFLKSAAVAAVAALIVIVTLQGVILRRSQSNDLTDRSESFSAPPQSNYLARVQASRDVVWADDMDGSIRGDGWITGGVVNLKAGVAEIAFNSGARAFVEGPARLSVESQNRTFLEFGKITAEVSKEASGFTVNTPRMNIVDIGTRFGVSVDESGETEVHVMEGKILASRSSGNAVEIEITEGSAIKADSRELSSLNRLPYEGDQFELSAGSWRDPSPIIRYDFDESGGAVIVDSGSQSRGGPYDLILIGNGMPLDEQPRRSPGYNGGGLVFQESSPLVTPLSRDLRLSEPFTISFFMKIPPKVGRRLDDFVIGWGSEGVGWEIGCQNSQGRGALVARLGKDAFVAGSTDLADGKWHHVAIRYIGGEKSNLSSHLHLYVDGMLETISSWNSGAVAEGPVGELRIGDLKQSGFPGWIDQISIFDEAISTRAIQKMVNR